MAFWIAVVLSATPVGSALMALSVTEIVTTDDDNSSPIVWIVGAEGDDRLHGFRADTGAPVFSGGGSGDSMTGLRHFATILASDDRLFIGGDGRIYAFKP